MEHDWPSQTLGVAPSNGPLPAVRIGDKLTRFTGKPFGFTVGRLTQCNAQHTWRP
jgi:hypothetical protein